MKISINTVPSGHADYGWYFGGRPAWVASLDNLCDPVHAATSDKAFFAALESAPGGWRLLLQDCIGTDTFTRRPARATVAIEIPSSAPGSADCARRLLVSWLDPAGRLLPLVKTCVDVSSDTVRVDERALYDGVALIGSGTTLASAPPSASRIVRRLAPDASNAAALRREAAGFVSSHGFPHSSGVQFLFSFAPYSTDPASRDALPPIPAPFIVLGHREEESEPPPPQPMWWIAVVLLSALILVTLLHSCPRPDRRPPPRNPAADLAEPPSAPTSIPTVNLQPQDNP